MMLMVCMSQAYYLHRTDRMNPFLKEGLLGWLVQYGGDSSNNDCLAPKRLRTPLFGS